jgi:hypothetical protein
MNAIDELGPHSRSMTDGYGNVGHCGSWIEINGVEISENDLHEYRVETDPSNFVDCSCIHAVSKTEWCRNYIKSISMTLSVQ